MDVNLSVWHRYAPGWVSPDFVPYLRELTTDRWGNKVEINRWKKQGPLSTVQPELVRINKGLTFQRLFETDPCPPGWEKLKNDPSGYCYQAPLRHEPVFYTDKAFIAKNQFWQGPGDPSPANGELDRNAGFRQVSEQSDLRSVSPLTGNYTVFYQPLPSAAKTRYVGPVPKDVKYDANWNLSRQSHYASMATQDSYLG